MVEIAYVLGSTRSGTSALRNALAETRFSGFGEGHLAPILIDIIRTVHEHKTSGLGAHVPGTGIYKMRENVLVRHIFHGYEQYLALEIKNQYIVDKTPTIEPIIAAADLNRFHHHAWFLHCSRRHLDNVASKMKKFPDETLEQHCREWALCNEAWLNVRDGLGDNFLEFDFFDLVTDPEGMSAKIGEYLDLSDDDVAAMTSYLVSERPEGTPQRDLTKYLKLSELDWTDDEKDVFLRICEPLGKSMGYGLETYFCEQ